VALRGPRWRVKAAAADIRRRRGQFRSRL